MNTPDPIPPITESRRFKLLYLVFQLLLLILALALAWTVASPFLNTLVLATVLAILFAPMNRRINTLLGGKSPGLAASITVLLASVVILLPFSFFLYGLLVQGKQSLADITAWSRTNDISSLMRFSFLDPYLAWVQQRVPFIDLTGLDIEQQLLGLTTDFTRNLVTFGRTIAGNAAMLAFHFMIMMGLLFYLVRDGQRIMERIRYLCPLRPKQEDLIIDTLKRVSRSVLVGSLSVAGLQGIAGGVGLALCDLPGFFWGTMMGLASLVPVLGTGLVWVPACIYLAATGQWQWSIFLALWCGIFVVGIDTFLRPMFLQEASRVSAFFIFLAILGGIMAFGALGLLYGPLILCFVMVMLEIYGEEYRDVLCNLPPE